MRNSKKLYIYMAISGQLLRRLRDKPIYQPVSRFTSLSTILQGKGQSHEESGLTLIAPYINHRNTCKLIASRNLRDSTKRINPQVARTSDRNQVNSTRSSAVWGGFQLKRPVGLEHCATGSIMIFEGWDLTEQGARESTNPDVTRRLHDRWQVQPLINKDGLGQVPLGIIGVVSEHWAFWGFW